MLSLACFLQTLTFLWVNNNDLFAGIWVISPWYKWLTSKRIVLIVFYLIFPWTISRDIEVQIRVSSNTLLYDGFDMWYNVILSNWSFSIRLLYYINGFIGLQSTTANFVIYTCTYSISNLSGWHKSVWNIFCTFRSTNWHEPVLWLIVTLGVSQIFMLHLMYAGSVNSNCSLLSR